MVLPEKLVSGLSLHLGLPDLGEKNKSRMPG